MPPEKTRLKDIARLAGVSIGTVDRVLHNRGEVAEKTMRRVREILRETNYSPDVMARGLKSRKICNLVSLLPEPAPDNIFWSKHPSGIERAVRELELFRLTLSQVTFDMSDEQDFERKALKVIEMNPDGVLLAPIFKSESIGLCRNLRERKIPFVFVDGFIEETEFLAYIGEDAYSSGRVAGQLADMITPRGDDILIVIIAKNVRNVQHLNNRTKGFSSYFSNQPSSRGKRLMINIPDPSNESLEKALDRVFEENQNIASIYMSGSKSYLIAAYLEKKNKGNISLIGYDLLDKNISYLRSGTIRFLIGQRPEEQTYKAVKKLFEFISLNRIPERKEYLPVDIITSENVNFYI
jgi:LacI family transcriptional regulator